MLIHFEKFFFYFAKFDGENFELYNSKNLVAMWKRPASDFVNCAMLQIDDLPFDFKIIYDSYVKRIKKVDNGHEERNPSPYNQAIIRGLLEQIKRIDIRLLMVMARIWPNYWFSSFVSDAAWWFLDVQDHEIHHEIDDLNYIIDPFCPDYWNGEMRELAQIYYQSINT